MLYYYDIIESDAYTKLYCEVKLIYQILTISTVCDSLAQYHDCESKAQYQCMVHLGSRST